MAELQPNPDNDTYNEIEKSVFDAFNIIEDMYDGKFERFKVFTGYDDIDNLISGLHCGDLITVAGGSGSGKTTFLANIAMNIAVRSIQEIAFAGLQHIDEQMGLRFIAKECNVVMREIIRGYIRREEWKALVSKAAGIAESSLMILNAASENIEYFIGSIRTLKKEKPEIKLLIIDSVR